MRSATLLSVALFLSFWGGECLHLPPRSAGGAFSRRGALARAGAGASAALLGLGANPGRRAGAAAPPAYQGVYADPRHPKGYRVLFGDDRRAAVKLRDAPGGEESELPVRMRSEAGGTRLTFDFSPKGGPRDVEGVLGGDGRSIAFPDGNVWTRDEAGIVGVYAVSDAPGTVVAVRPFRFNELQASLIEGGTSTVATFGAKAGSQKAFFEYPGEFNRAGRIDSERGTLTFRDGTVWTRY